MLLINSPNAEQLLVGVMQETGIRSPGCFDSIRDVNVNEVIKNAAVQLNVCYYYYIGIDHNHHH